MTRTWKPRPGYSARPRKHEPPRWLIGLLMLFALALVVAVVTFTLGCSAPRQVDGVQIIADETGRIQRVDVRRAEVEGRVLSVWYFTAPDSVTVHARQGLRIQRGGQVMGRAGGVDWFRVAGYVITLGLAGVAVWWSLNGRLSACENYVTMHQRECEILEAIHAEEKAANAEQHRTVRDGFAKFGKAISDMRTDMQKLELENVKQHGLISQSLTVIQADVKHLRNGN